MNKLLLRYIIYFGIFICFIQIVECPQVHDLCAKIGLAVDFSLLGEYAPLFLSVLLIDVTYRIGVKQTEIQNKQLELQKHQIDVAEYQLYRTLYRVIGDIKQFPRHLLYRMYSYTENDIFYKHSPEYWGKEANKLSTIQEEYKECIVDLDLILGNRHVIPKIYLLKLSACEDIISYMKELVASNLLVYGGGSDIDFYKMPDDEIIEYIIGRVPDDYKKHLKRNLNYILEPIKDNEFIETIENKYRLRKD